MFAWFPIEELIRERQQEYYNALAVSDNNADCTEFAEMMMNVILDALSQLDKIDQVKALIEWMRNDELLLLS